MSNSLFRRIATFRRTGKVPAALNQYTVLLSIAAPAAGSKAYPTLAVSGVVNYTPCQLARSKVRVQTAPQISPPGQILEERLREGAVQSPLLREAITDLFACNQMIAILPTGSLVKRLSDHKTLRIHLSTCSGHAKGLDGVGGPGRPYDLF